MAVYTSDTFKPLLNRLVQTPEYFSPNDLKVCLDHLFTPNALHPAQIGAFLTALHVHRVERRPDYLATAASVLRERALKAEVEHLDDFVVDIVGTGGDGFNLFNVSTTAAVVAAGAGARVIKVTGSCFYTYKHLTSDISDSSMAVGLPRHPRDRLIFWKLSIAFSLRRQREPQSPSLAFPSPSSWHHTITLP